MKLTHNDCEHSKCQHSKCEHSERKRERIARVGDRLIFRERVIVN